MEDIKKHRSKSLFTIFKGDVNSNTLQKKNANGKEKKGGKKGNKGKERKKGKRKEKRKPKENAYKRKNIEGFSYFPHPKQHSFSPEIQIFTKNT